MVRASGATRRKAQASRNVSNGLEATGHPDMTEPAPAGATFRDSREGCYPPGHPFVKRKNKKDHQLNNELESKKLLPVVCRSPSPADLGSKLDAQRADAVGFQPETGVRDRRSAGHLPVKPPQTPVRVPILRRRATAF